MSTLKLAGLKPEKLWNYFESLCGIPHPSKHEKQIITYLIGVCKAKGWDYSTDEVENLLIRKPATPGMENRQKVVLQAHVDMVPQKNAATVHDFEKDAIKPFVDGEWVKAEGTTLGADNGIGVSAALAVLDSTDLQHGPLEVILTIDEETGMTGAFNLKPGFVTGDILMNLDSEDEGELYIGCAGGVNSQASLTYKVEAIPAGYTAFKFSLTGLKGGHSGLEINLGRANANKLINRFLWKATQQFQIRLASLEGGNLRNAIPREAFAEILVPADKVSGLQQFVKTFEKEIWGEYQPVETALKVELSAISTPAGVMDVAAQNTLLSLVYALPNGTIRLTPEMPEVVETSTNLSIVKVANGQIDIKLLLRSAVESCKNDLLATVEAAYQLAGYKYSSDGSYPGWKPNLQSPILSVMKKVYLENFGKEPEVKVIHAGLECGIIGDVYPNLDMVSFGPTIRHPHSPDEKVNIATVEKFWKYLTLSLANVPLK